MTSLSVCKPNLVSSEYGTLDSWCFSPAFRCDPDGKKIAGLIMEYVDEIFCREPELLTSSSKDTRRFLYGQDVFIVTDQFLGKGYEKAAYLAIAYFQQIECVALIPHYQNQSTCKLEDEYQLAAQLNGQRGLLGAMGYYGNQKDKILITPKFDGTLEAYLNANQPCSLDSWKVVALHLFDGIKKMNDGGLTHQDLVPRNILMKYNSKNEIVDCVLCDYASVVRLDPFDDSSFIWDRLTALQIIKDVGLKTKEISTELQKGKPFLDIVKTLLGAEFPFDDTSLFEYPQGEEPPLYDLDV